MLVHSLLVAHIAVLGYWLGSELVINGTYRYVSWAREMTVQERVRLMDHVMNVDQHVRYALVLQFGLGFSLVFLLGYLPGSKAAAMAVAVLALAWLVLVEMTHRFRKTPLGHKLTVIDRGIRYFMIAGLVLLPVAVVLGNVMLPAWLAWKLACFAAVMSCGVGIRLVLIRLFGVWQDYTSHGPSDEREELLRSIYHQATSILYLLWIFIAAMVVLSVVKPI